MKNLVSCITIVFLLLIPFAANSAIKTQKDTIIIANDYFNYEIGTDGKNISFIDKKNSKDYLKKSPESFVAVIKKSGKDFNASEVSMSGGLLTMKFGESGIQAQLKITIDKQYVFFDVISVSDESIDEMTFVNIPLDITAKMTEPFGACVLSVNLKTNVVPQPGLMPELKAACYSRFELIGAKAAIIGCPPAKLRNIIKKVVLVSPEIPKTLKGGAWSLDDKADNKSFVLNVFGIRLNEVDSWIKMCKDLGMTGIDFHTGNGWLRFGDYKPYPAYPDGINELKQVVVKLHKAGIKATLHTYSMCLAKDGPYVTPVPDPRLKKKLRYTLSAPLTVDSTVMSIAENPGDISQHSMYGSANSTTLKIDNELITFTGISKESPYGLTGCVRGAYGTKVSEHSIGAEVYEMTQVFDLFMPDPKTDMIEEIAKNIAYVYNECDLDGFYFDAIDGTFILEGWDDAWHYASRLVYDVARETKKPGIYDYSAFWHHFWYLRWREGGWDSSKRGHKSYTDIHAYVNEIQQRILLPSCLGLTDFWTYKTSVYPERTFPDDVEYLCAKSVGNDSCHMLGIAMTPKALASNQNLQRLGGIIKKWEALRLSQYFPNSIKAKLRVPGNEYTLKQTAKNKWQVAPVEYNKHKVEAINENSSEWQIRNKYQKQPLKVLIEPLAVAVLYDSPESVTLTDFSKPAEFTDQRSNAGVSSSLTNVTSPVIAGSVSGRFSASNTDCVKEDAWTTFGTKTPLDLDMSNSGLGVWVYGDGKGEVINLRLMTPRQDGYGQDEYYVPVDFIGWRYFELVEPETDRVLRYGWPYMVRRAEWYSLKEPWEVQNGGYQVYQVNSMMPAYRKRVEFMNLWLNNIPKGESVECFVSPVKALPLKNITIKNPAISVNGKKITFPVNLETGCYLEFRSMNDCKVYGPDSTIIKGITPIGSLPDLAAGNNNVSFSNDNQGERIRAKITVISEGKPLVK